MKIIHCVRFFYRFTLLLRIYLLLFLFLKCFNIGIIWIWCFIWRFTILYCAFKIFLAALFLKFVIILCTLFIYILIIFISVAFWMHIILMLWSYWFFFRLNSFINFRQLCNIIFHIWLHAQPFITISIFIIESL